MLSVLSTKLRDIVKTNRQETSYKSTQVSSRATLRVAESSKFSQCKIARSDAIKIPSAPLSFNALHARNNIPQMSAWPKISFSPMIARYYSSISKPTIKPILIGEKPEPTIDDFRHLIRKNSLVVDKSLIIKEFWEGPACQLIVRPRRSGKSLLLSMMNYFFAPQSLGKESKSLFEGFAITDVDNGEFTQKHQGQYPVIAVSFKDVKNKTYQEALQGLRGIFTKLYWQHETLLTSDKLSENDKREFRLYLEGKADNERLQNALEFLSRFLYKAYECDKHEKGVIILIDEYDAPLSAAYQYGFIDSLSLFMRNMLSAALKSNPYLEKSLMTGVLRISQSGMLSGLNNLITYTVLDSQYQQYFGFDEVEVDALLQHASKRLPMIQPGDQKIVKGVKAFYNGYKVGDTTLYNPWSLMQFILNGALQSYWVLTSDDALLKKVLLTRDENVKKQFGQLILGESITCDIDLNLRYEDLMDKPQAIWTLLLFGGYLTAETQERLGSHVKCQVKIPNEEVLRNYTGIFAEYLKETIGFEQYDHFLKKLVDGDIRAFTKDLSAYMSEALSVRDVHGEKEQPERFYHGMMMGLIAPLHSDYVIRSNRESGEGFYDIILIPKVSTDKDSAIIIECKRVRGKGSLEKAAKAATGQIKLKNYASDLTMHPHIKRVTIAGFAFNDKSVAGHSSEIVIPL